MGTWGTGISSNDSYADIYYEFIDLYNQGHSINEITQHLINENQDLINTPEDANDFWFAIATGQWECKALSKEILETVEQIIQSGDDIQIWKAKDASPKDLKAREKVLVKFLAKLKIEKDKPRKRIKKKLYSSIFRKGDCLTFKMDNGNYGGAFVLTDEIDTSVGLNTIAILDIDKITKPTIEDFKKAEVYVKRTKTMSLEGNELKEKWSDRPEIAFFFAGLFKKEKLDIDIVGQLHVYKEYTLRDRGFGWHVLKSTIPFKEEYIKINGKPERILKLSKWTKKHWL